MSKWKEVDLPADECGPQVRREQLISEMVSFMQDCGFSAEHVNVLNVLTVAESAHRPVRGFWQAFDFSTVLDALDAYLPEWRSLPPEMGMAMPLDEFILEIRRQMWMNAFDEENAERFFALTAAERPSSAAAALAQIGTDLRRIGAFSNLAQLQADGISAGARAFDIYRCIDAADSGKTYLTSLGRTVKDCRDAARKRLHNLATKGHARNSTS